MQILVKGRHVKVTPALRGYAEKRLEKIGRYASKGFKAVVTLWVEGFRHIAEISIWGRGVALQAEGRTEGMYASIDGAAARATGQLKKHKGKVHHQRKEGAR